MPSGEITITLQDVAFILGLQIDGPAVTGETTPGATWAVTCEELLGVRPLPADIVGSRVSASWLSTNFSEFSGTLSWGSAMLAYLYRHLCLAADMATEEIGGSVILLQLWAWEHFPHIAPVVRDGREWYERPLGVRWATAFAHRRHPTHVVRPYRDAFDMQSPDQDVPVEKEITNDDVLGDAIPFDQQQRLQQACCYALKLPPTNKGRTPFPGSHPVSLSRDNLQLLRTRYYYATWKADGTRYMMLITHHGCYLIDRNFCFRRVQLRFPVRNASEGIQLHHVTLIDGEMIIDIIPTTDPSTGRTEKKLERRYLAYDLMVLNSESVSERPFSERWKLLEKEVIEPRNIDRRQNPIYRYDLEPFRVRRKDFWLLSTVNKLLKEFIPALSHEADGLIFQGWDDPYVTRTHEGLLKWKYPEMNSVDFLFEEEDGRQLLYLFERGKKKLMDGAHVVFKDDIDVSMISGKVVECSYDQEGKVWSCMRIRMDKSTPNDINTFYKVRKSIEDNITEDVLLEEIGEIVQLPMYADRIARAQQLQHAHFSQRRR